MSKHNVTTYVYTVIGLDGDTLKDCETIGCTFSSDDAARECVRKVADSYVEIGDTCTITTMEYTNKNREIERISIANSEHKLTYIFTLSRIDVTIM